MQCHCYMFTYICCWWLLSGLFFCLQPLADKTGRYYSSCQDVSTSLPYQQRLSSSQLELPGSSLSIHNTQLPERTKLNLRYEESKRRYKLHVIKCSYRYWQPPSCHSKILNREPLSPWYYMHRMYQKCKGNITYKCVASRLTH